MRFGFFFLRILPWWGYLALAGFLAWITLSIFDDLQATRANVDLARLAGPPPVTALDTYDDRRTPTPLGEARVSGILRVDLGVNRLGDSSTSRSYVVLDSESGRGPLMALVLSASDVEVGLRRLMADAGRDGRVEVAGFRRSTDNGEIAGQLQLKGEARDVVALEPYFGNRDAVLAEKAESDLPFVIGFAVLAGLALLTAGYKFRRWRRRVGARAGINMTPPAAAQPRAPKAPAQLRERTDRAPRPPREPRKAQVVTPDGQVMELDTATPARPAKSGQPNPWAVGKPAAQGRPAMPEMPSGRRLMDEAARIVPDMRETTPQTVTEATTGQPFRFKTPEEIIKASFGRVTPLNRAPGSD